MESLKLEEMSVSETLLIPLLAKAKDSMSSAPIIRDSKSLEIAEQLEIDKKRFEGGTISDHGIIVRTEVLDNELRQLQREYKKLTIINLGAGLDTRISRMDNQQLRWYELDLPEVISLRRKFFNENERVTFIAKSVLDESWINDIVVEEDCAVVVIAEGLLMYFTESEVRQIFTLLSKSFPKAHMLFDVVHTYFSGKSISSQFLWGIDEAKDIEKLCNSIRLVDSWSTGNLHKEKQPLFLRMMNVMKSTRNRSQILHICFNKI